MAQIATLVTFLADRQFAQPNFPKGPSRNWGDDDNSGTVSRAYCRVGIADRVGFAVGWNRRRSPIAKLRRDRVQPKHIRLRRAVLQLVSTNRFCAGRYHHVKPQ